LSRSIRIPVSASTLSSTCRFVALSWRLSAFADSPSLGDVGVEDVAGGRQEPCPLLDRKLSQEAAVADDRLERLDRDPQGIGGVAVVAVFHGSERSEAEGLDSTPCQPVRTSTRSSSSTRRP